MTDAGEDGRYYGEHLDESPPQTWVHEGTTNVSPTVRDRYATAIVTMNRQFDTAIEGNRLRAELYVSAATCGTHEKQRGAIRTMERLVDEGVLDAFENHMWAGRLTTMSPDSWCRLARKKYDEFEAWARSAGHSLGPAFSKETVTNEFVDDEYDVIRFPVVTLAVYDDDHLVRVAPTGHRDLPYTIDDCLEELEGMDDRFGRERAAALEH